METSQGNSLYKYPYPKCHIFIYSFFSYKIGEQDGGTGPAQERVLTPVGGGGDKERDTKSVYTCI
jgi:hypothetical protein